MFKAFQPLFPVNMAVFPKPDAPLNDAEWVSYLHAKGVAWEQNSPTVEDLVSFELTFAMALEFQRHEYEKKPEMAAYLKQTAPHGTDAVPVGISSHDFSNFLPDPL